MVKGVVGAVVVSFAAWVVMRHTGLAGPDADLYGDLLRQAWTGAVDVFRWLVRAPEQPHRFVLVVAAAVGFSLGVKAGR